MAARTKPPFGADHVGSLLRPPELSACARTRPPDRSTPMRIVRMQRDVGLRGVTDGEFRRTSWHLDFICAQRTARPCGA